MKRFVIIFAMLVLSCYHILANTTRDIEPAPDYNSQKIKKLVILYINLERVNRGNAALLINNKVEAAAQWHSDYMAGTEKISHIAIHKGMHDVQERVTTFGENISRYAEILTFYYSINAANIKFQKIKDKDGEYLDFGKTNVRWYSETEIAMGMFNSLMTEAINIKYLSSEALNSIGGGISPGKSSDIQSWYGSFAIVEKKNLFIKPVKQECRKEVIRKKIDGGDKDEKVLTYTITGLTGNRACLLAVKSSGEYKVYFDTAITGNFKFRIDDDFRSRLTGDEKLYVSTVDVVNDTYYPVMFIEAINFD